MIHLDTNFLIQISVAGSVAHTQFAAWASAQEVLNVSTIAWAEFLCGPMDACGRGVRTTNLSPARKAASVNSPDPISFHRFHA